MTFLGWLIEIKLMMLVKSYENCLGQILFTKLLHNIITRCTDITQSNRTVPKIRYKI